VVRQKDIELSDPPEACARTAQAAPHGGNVRILLLFAKGGHALSLATDVLHATPRTLGLPADLTARALARKYPEISASHYRSATATTCYLRPWLASKTKSTKPNG
jgi:hypothetical protein